MRQERLYLRSTLNHDGFPEFAKHLGANVSALRRDLGLVPRVFMRQCNFVPWNAVCEFYERAAKEIKDPYLGIRYALQAKPDFRGTGPAVYMGALSKDISSFCKAIVNYQSIRTNGIAYSVAEDFEKSEITGQYTVNKGSVACHQLIASTMVLGTLTGKKLIPGFKIKYASFAHKKPSDTSLYEQAFEAPVHFEAEDNRIVAHIEDYTIRDTQLTGMFRGFALKAYFDSHIKNCSKAQKSVIAFVETILPHIVGTYKTDIETFALSLDMHPKKLQRLLKDEGSSYTFIRDNIRKELATKLLTNTHLSISHIAALLEYSSDRPFTTAFKRWHNLTPTKYRKACSL